MLHELLSCPLRLRLYDHDRLSRDDPLGEARVFLREHLTSGGVLDARLTEPLDLPDQGKKAHKVSSSITLHVTWSEKQGTAAAREAEAEAEAARDEVRLRPHALEALHWRPPRVLEAAALCVRACNHACQASDPSSSPSPSPSSSPSPSPSP